jgi:hypothetical protein
MPPFFNQAVEALWDLLYSAEQAWGHLSVTVRIIGALAIGAGFVLFGARAENTGWSTFMFFVAFGFLSYVLAVGIYYVR